TTRPRLGRSCALPFVGGDTAAAARRGGASASAAVDPVADGVVWVGTPCRGLILPPPGGAPYLATISGVAMIAPWPRTRVVRVIGILSSSTHTYSGSLATSPNRGFLISSHRVSAALMVTEGSPAGWPPRICFKVEQPEVANAATTATTTRHCPFMTRSYHIRADRESPQPSLTGSHGNRCSSAAAGGKRGSRRENIAVPVTAEIHVTST